MKHLSHDALISAYFDGEASAAQCAEVERLLRENPGTSIALETVIRKAERAMLLDHDKQDDQRDVKHAGGNGKASHPLVLPFTQHSKSVLTISTESVSRNGSLPKAPVPNFVATKQRWNAPVGLAAAASLFLFIGLIAFANRQGPQPKRIVDRGTIAEDNGGSENQKNASGLADLQKWGRKLSLGEVEDAAANGAVQRGSLADLSMPDGSSGKSFRNGKFKQSAAMPKRADKFRLAIDSKENADARGVTFNEKDDDDRAQKRSSAIKLLYAETETRRELSEDKQELSLGPALVVCDVEGIPDEVYCRFEAVLREHKIVNRRVLLTDEEKELTENAKKNKDRIKDTESAQSRQSQLAAISSRLYLVDVSPDQFAAALRKDKTLHNLEISISSLSLPNSDRVVGYATTTVLAPPTALKSASKPSADAPPRLRGKEPLAIGRPTMAKRFLLDSRFRADALGKLRQPKNPGETPTAGHSTIFVLRVTRPIASAKKPE